MGILIAYDTSERRYFWTGALMAIAIQCGQCGKNYRVDDKLVGRRVKCKNCGGAIPVPAPGTNLPTNPFAASATPHEDDLLGGLKAASQSESLSAAPQPAMKYPTRAGGHPTAATAARDCPACASAMPPNAIICTTCGFNIRTNTYMETQIAPPVVAPTPARHQTLSYAKVSDSEERDRDGFRQNVPFKNPGLDLLNRFMVGLGYWLYMILLGLGGILGLYVMTKSPSPGKDVPRFILTYGLQIALFFLVYMPILLKGLEIAGGFLRFRFPEDTFQRVIASWSYIGFAWLIIIVVVIIGVVMGATAVVHSMTPMHPPTVMITPSGAAPATTSPPSALSIMAIVSAIGFTLLAIGIFIHITLQFLTAWFFFRLKFVEALVTTALLLVFQVLASLINWGIVLIIKTLVVMVFGPDALT